MYNQNIKMAITRLPDFAPFLRWCVCVRRSITVTLSVCEFRVMAVPLLRIAIMVSLLPICLQKKVVSFM